jgi:predicted transcriptional regulator
MLLLTSPKHIRSLEEDAQTLGCSRQSLHATKQALVRLGIVTSIFPTNGENKRLREIVINPIAYQKLMSCRNNPNN